MVEYLARLLKRVNDERGQALAEYTLILAFIAMVCVVALGVLGLAVAGELESVTDAFP